MYIHTYIHMHTYIYIHIHTYIIYIYSLLSFCLIRAAPMACAGSQAGGPIGAVAAGLHHSHSSAGSELCLRPTPQLTAMLDPQPTDPGQGSNLQPHGS